MAGSARHIRHWPQGTVLMDGSERRRDVEIYVNEAKEAAARSKPSGLVLTTWDAVCVCVCVCVFTVCVLPVASHLLRNTSGRRVVVAAGCRFPFFTVDNDSVRTIVVHDRV